MGTEITTDDCVGITGFRVMLFGGYIFGVPEGGNCWNVLEDVLGSYKLSDIDEGGRYLLALTLGLHYCDASPRTLDN